MLGTYAVPKELCQLCVSVRNSESEAEHQPLIGRAVVHVEHVIPVVLPSWQERKPEIVDGMVQQAFPGKMRG